MQPLLHSSKHAMHAIIGSQPNRMTAGVSIELLKAPNCSIDNLHVDNFRSQRSLSKHVSNVEDSTMGISSRAPYYCIRHGSLSGVKSR